METNDVLEFVVEQITTTQMIFILIMGSIFLFCAKDISKFLVNGIGALRTDGVTLVIELVIKFLGVCSLLMFIIFTWLSFL